jgi:type II secretion system protein J
VTRRHAAFTLIEMMAVMLLLGILVSSVVNFYIQLSRESNAAAAATRGSRRAVAALDRIARELESTILVIRPDGEDPLSHPWLFWAEREGGGDGADTLRFTTRGRRPRASAAYESDLAVVGYTLRESPDGPESGSELLRWTSPRLPDGLERNVPRDEQDGAQVLVDGVTEFGLRFLTEDGEWKEEWDSSTVDSNLLPLAAEIRLALAEELDSGLEARPASQRQVVLALRPLDLQALLTADDEEGDAGENEEEEEEEEAESNEEEQGEQACVTVNQCLASNPGLLDGTGVTPEMAAAVGDQCASDFGSLGALPQDCQ